MHKVFVYGTLRIGGSNHFLLEGTELLGNHKTPPVYFMVDLTGCPAVLLEGTTAITGEVYQVDDETLAELDALEGYPWNYYRQRIQTEWGEAWVYIYNDCDSVFPEIISGNWVTYSDQSKDGGL